MLRVSTSEHLVRSQDSTDAKDNGDFPLDSPEKVNKSTVLVASEERDDPVVTRKELWSYYRRSSPTSSISVFTDLDSLLQWRQCKSSPRSSCYSER